MSPFVHSLYRGGIAPLLCVLAVLELFASRGDAGTLAQFRTIYGDIEVELFDQEKPVTVGNFVRYVRGRAYENMFFHRCAPGFVLQGGGFFTTNRHDIIPLENVFSVPRLPPITNEFFVGPRKSNTFGTIAMAQSGTDRNSATSQWFFNTANNSAGQPNDLDALNGGFAVFGRTVRGTNLLASFNNRFNGFGLVDLGGAFSELPVNFIGLSFPTYTDLIYVDISLLNVQVKKVANNAREISWTSVTNRPNVVEFTTNFPPAWQTLVNTNGNGLTLQVTDDSTNAPRRFYRVRVNY